MSLWIGLLLAMLPRDQIPRQVGLGSPPWPLGQTKNQNKNKNYVICATYAIGLSSMTCKSWHKFLIQKGKGHMNSHQYDQNLQSLSFLLEA